jgi:hypothetical protein
MTARRQPTTPTRPASTRPASARAALPVTLLTLALGPLLAGCGPLDTTDTGSDGPTTQTPATVTVTTTVTPSPTATRPVPTKPTGPTLDQTPTTPPPGKDAAAIPRSAQDYGIAFVTAWAKGDRSRATQLGTDTAVKAAFATAPGTAPRFDHCEGAAGSSYCTWVGDEYTLQLRIGNDLASRGQLHAVIEVVFKH